MESFKRALENIGRLWSNLTATQRVVIGAAAALMIVLLLFSTTGTTQAWVRVAGAEGDQAGILKKLRERNQKHELRGTDIYVPKEDADRIVMELAGDGSMNEGAVWKFLEQSNIIDTRWDKEQKLQIALQMRLEIMIRSIESVRNARVLINRGSTSHQLGFVGPKPSASVQLELKPEKTLSRHNVQAIAGTVARAVAGIEEDQVHIMDTKGHAYRAVKINGGSPAAGTLWELERDKEKQILDDIKGGFAFSGASVVVRIQTNSATRKSEEVTPGRVVPVKTSEIIRTNKKSGSGVTGVRKGEGESVPEPAPGGDESVRENQEENFVGTRKVVEDNPAGDIKGITVGVLIPVEEGPRLTEAERLLPRLREFVRHAAGPQARMEDISVQLIPTKAPDPLPPMEESVKALAWVWSNWPKVVLGLVALFAVWVLFRVIQRSTAQDTVEELQALTTALTETREGPAGLVAPAETDLGRLRQGIQDMVGRNPQTVAASLKSFMSGR